MNQLYLMCSDFVKANVSTDDSELQDILTTSILALYLLKGSFVFDKLSTLLPDLIVISDNRSVSQVLHDIGHNSGEHMLACLSRHYQFTGNEGFEERFLIIPREKDNELSIQMIEKTIHELTHLLRCGPLWRDDDNVYLCDGIATKKIQIQDKSLLNHYAILEESIVQDTANKALSLLAEYSNEVTISPAIEHIKLHYKDYESILYRAHIILLNLLLQDPSFQELVSQSFYSFDVSPLRDYYNSIMNDDKAFERLSHYFNQMDSFIEQNNTDETIKFVNQIKHDIRSYFNQLHQKKKELTNQ